jgi:hypothetical protein
VAEADLTPADAAQVMALIETFPRTLETSEIEGRLPEMENMICGAV